MKGLSFWLSGQATVHTHFMRAAVTPAIPILSY